MHGTLGEGPCAETEPLSGVVGPRDTGAETPGASGIGGSAGGGDSGSGASGNGAPDGPGAPESPEP